MCCAPNIQVTECLECVSYKPWWVRKECSLDGKNAQTCWAERDLVIIIASSVSPDTVLLLSVSTRFYLGVHAVRCIARTVYGLYRVQPPLASSIDCKYPPQGYPGRYGTTRLSQRRAREAIRQLDSTHIL